MSVKPCQVLARDGRGTYRFDDESERNTMGFTCLLVEMECIDRPIVVIGAVLFFRNELRKQCAIVGDVSKERISVQIFRDLVTVHFVKSQFSRRFIREIDLQLQRRN